MVAGRPEHVGQSHAFPLEKIQLHIVHATRKLAHTLLVPQCRTVRSDDHHRVLQEEALALCAQGVEPDASPLVDVHDVKRAPLEPVVDSPGRLHVPAAPQLRTGRRGERYKLDPAVRIPRDPVLNGLPLAVLPEGVEHRNSVARFSKQAGQRIVGAADPAVADGAGDIGGDDAGANRSSSHRSSAARTTLTHTS